MKFKIKDNRNRTYLVQKKLKSTKLGDKTIKDAENEELTAAEIKKLKDLAKYAKDILALVAPDDEDNEVGEEEFDLEKDEDVVNLSEEEEVIEDSTDDTFIEDSKKAFGSVETKKKVIVDEAIDRDTEIANAWKNRYGGK